MTRDPRIGIAACAHALVTGSLVWLIATARLPLWARIVLLAVVAAALLPGLRALATNRIERVTRLALLLVLVIGVGIVEVLATGARWHASLLLGSAMLEFAVLLSLARGRAAQAAREPARR
ncbi:MAG: hypothetical protein PVF63_04715 [Gammaproteobacteria bacterium]|jgi:heme A synthase